MRYPLDEAKRFSGDAAAGSGRAAWRGMFPPVCQELYVARRRARAIAQAIFTRTAALRIARAMPPRRPVATAARLGSKSASRIGPPAAAFDIGRAMKAARRRRRHHRGFARPAGSNAKSSVAKYIVIRYYGAKRPDAAVAGEKRKGGGVDRLPEHAPGSGGW